MATSETQIILNAETGQAVKNVRELQDVIKGYKQALQDENATVEENKATAHELATAQAALRDVMNASSEASVKAAKNVDLQTASYNTLVHAMADLTKEWRSTTDAVERADLSKHINDINDKLKELDASRGNFSRNVGDYTNSIKAAFEGANLSGTTLGKTIKTIDTSSKLMSSNPLFGILTLVLPVITKIVEKVKDTDTAMNAANKAMSALEPIGNAVAKVVETLAGWVAKVVDGFAKMASESSGTFGKIVAGAAGVGNSLLQYLLIPIRSIVEAFKGLGNIVKDVFTGKWSDVKKHASETAQGIGEAFKKGFDIRGNFAAGRAAGMDFINGLSDIKVKDKAAEAGSDIGKALADSFEKEFDRMLSDLDREMDAAIKEALDSEKEANEQAQRLVDIRLDGLEKATDYRLRLNEITAEDDKTRAEQEYEILRTSNARRLALLRQYAKEALDRSDMDAYLALDQEASDLEVEMELNALEEKKRIREQDLKDAQEKAKARVALMQSAASAVSGIIGSLADIYESDTNASEAELKRVKNLRIAGATIDMLSGVVTAISQAQQLGPITGPIMAAVNSAAVIAAGVANIAKIKQQSTSSTSSSSSAATSAVVSAPSVETQVQTYRNLTSASEEDRLNQMASDQRVVLVMSDLEVAQGQRRVQTAETSF